jgi:hypothetical protein
MNNLIVDVTSTSMSKKIEKRNANNDIASKTVKGFFLVIQPNTYPFRKVIFSIQLQTNENLPFTKMLSQCNSQYAIRTNFDYSITK